MSKLVVQNNQGVFDVSLILTGGIEEAALRMIAAEDFNPTYQPGQIVESDSIESVEVKEYLSMRVPSRHPLNFFEIEFAALDFDPLDFDTNDFY
ncbi:MAG: hypothetical protein N4A41_05425 [Crocinitomicaceae bacterium]|jgi:hypothetical protein|nr:hypothetical protein [Crocinitomicaceae bacterium]